MFKKSLLSLLSLLLINANPAMAKGGGRIVYDPSNFSKNAASLSTQLKNTAYQAQNAGTNAKSLIQLAVQLQKTREMLAIHQKNIQTLSPEQLLELKQNDITGYLLNNEEDLGVDKRIIREADNYQKSGAKKIPDSLKEYLLTNRQRLKLTDKAVEKLSDPNYQDQGDDYDIYSYIEGNKKDLTIDQRVIGNLLAQNTKETKELLSVTEDLGADAQALNAAFEAAYPNWEDPSQLSPEEFDSHVSAWRKRTVKVINKDIIDNSAGQYNANHIDNVKEWAKRASDFNSSDIDSQLKALQLNNDILVNILLAINQLNKISSSHFKAQAHVWKNDILGNSAGGGDIESEILLQDEVYEKIARLRKYQEYCSNSRKFRARLPEFCECMLNQENIINEEQGKCLNIKK